MVESPLPLASLGALRLPEESVAASPARAAELTGDPGFCEESYCLAYPDVAAVVAAGDLGSGEEHYRRFGRSEIEAGQRCSPFLAGTPARSALPVIVALIGHAAIHRKHPWAFLNPDERALVQGFAEELFETAYVGHFPDLRDMVGNGSIASGFDHWLEHGRQEIADGRRDVGSLLWHPVNGREPPPQLQNLLRSVTDWGILLRCCSRGEDYAAGPLVADGGAATATMRDLALARTIPGTLHPNAHLPGGLQAFECAPRIVAFYLPQYHVIPENESWWGPGFTEWTNVRKATPNFQGHWQPHIPLDHDYYDLADVTVQRRQASLAKEYGVAAFCYYLYWFNGRRVLERPLDQMLADRSIDNEFCVCWANENWTRTWDGKADDVLIGQVHTPESDRRFILDTLCYLADPRYLRVGGKLVLLVYRVDLLPDCRATAAIWRDEVRRAGLGELHLCAVQFYGITDPEPWGFDAAVEFPPHGWLVQENLPATPPVPLNPDFKGTILDYRKSVQWALSKPYPGYTWYRAAFPGWDNTARRQDTPHIFAHSDPLTFEAWLTGLLRQTLIMAPPEHHLVFVNAWNEWGEGAHLEPDESNGMLNLMALNSALNTSRREAWPLGILARLRRPGDYPGRSEDETALLNLLRASDNALGALTAQLRATGVNPLV